MAKPERRYTIKETAEIFGVHPVTVWRWCRQGILKAVRLPTGVHRIDADAVDELAAQIAKEAQIKVSRMKQRSMQSSAGAKARREWEEKRRQLDAQIPAAEAARRRKRGEP